jgi:hypothetical protein
VEREELLRWQAFAVNAASASELLRKLATSANVDKYDLAELVAEVFPEKISGEDMQFIWKWDFDNSGDGFSDRDIDGFLVHLVS